MKTHGRSHVTARAESASPVPWARSTLLVGIRSRSLQAGFALRCPWLIPFAERFGLSRLDAALALGFAGFVQRVLHE
jgi:hypothetical protein